jgi:hypothetical protein
VAIAKGPVRDLGALALKLFTFADGVEVGERLGQFEAHVDTAPAEVGDGAGEPAVGIVGASMVAIKAVPQSSQKRLPSGFSDPHLAQRIVASISNRSAVASYVPNSSSNALAYFKSAVSKPSVNEW